MSRQQVLERDQKWVLGTYARAPFFPVRGDGPYVWDDQGKRYLDFTSGIAVNALGHADPVVVAAIHEQASKLAHISNLYYFEGHGLLAERLCTLSGFDKAFFCNSGTEANEAAIKFVRKFWHNAGSAWRHEIVTFEQSFHGRTYGALAATGQDKMQTGFGPMLPGFVRAPLDAAGLEQAVGAHTAAVLLEPILAEGGVIEPSTEFLVALKALQAKHGFLLICDEIQTGLGRTAEWFGHTSLGLCPDIITLAKPLGGGLPLGAALVTARIAAALKPGDHGTTFGGNPVAVAAGLAVVDRLGQPGFMEVVQGVSQRLRSGLESLCTPNGPFLQVRGRGLLLGVKLTVDPALVIDAAREEGLIVYRAGPDILRLLPPLVITNEQVDEALAILARILPKL